MCLDDLRDVVSQRIRWVGVVPGEVTRIGPEATAIRGVRGECNRGDYTVKWCGLREQGAHGEGAGLIDWTIRRQENVVGSVTCHELIQKGRGNVSVQTGHKARSGSNEACGDVLETRQVAVRIRPPESAWYDRLPGVVDVAERQAVIVVDVVIETYQLFAPSSWF